MVTNIVVNFFNKFKSNFISIFLTLATTVLTYYTYEYLNNDDVRIENVEVKPLEFNITFSEETYEKLKKRFTGYIGLLSFLSQDQEFRPSILADEKEIKYILKKIYKKVKSLKEDLQGLKDITSLIEKMPDGVAMDKSPENIFSLMEPYYEAKKISKFKDSYNKDSKKAFKSMIQSTQKKQENIKNRIRDEEKFVQDIIEQVYEKINNNKNGYKIEVVLFNSGNQQAVVRYRGKISIDGTNINLKSNISDIPSFVIDNRNQPKASRNFLDDFVIIENRSFNGMTLVVDNYNTKDRDIEFSQREYFAGQKNGVLYIWDINNKIYQKEFKFRNALYEDKEEDFSKYLKSKYPEYIPLNMR